MLATTIFRTGKPHLRKALFLVRAIAPPDSAVSPRTGFFNQRMNSARFFDRLCKACFSFRMSREFHRKIHCVIGESYEKGGKQSKALWYTPATVSVVQSAWISEYFHRVRKWIKLILYSKPLPPLMADSSWRSHCKRLNSSQQSLILKSFDSVTRKSNQSLPAFLLRVFLKHSLH